MIKKKKIFVTTFALGLATVALVSCGKKPSDKNDNTDDSKKDDSSDVVPTVTYTVTLDTNDTAATFAEGTVKTFTVSNATELVSKIGTTKPTKTGYNFVGWYVDDACETAFTAATDLSTLTKESDGAIYIYAKYAINTYTVTFNLQGNAAVAAESSIASTANVEYEKSPTLVPSTFTTPAKDSLGHEMNFTGWYDNAECTGDPVDPTTTKIGENKTFYAGWTITKIESVAQFKDYVNQKEVKTNAYLAGNIEFDAADFIDRSAATCEKAGLTNETKTDLTNEFAAKFYGDGMTITGLTVKGDLKSTALFGKFSGTMEDVTFVSSTLESSAKSTTALIAGTVTGDATFSDVTFNGVTVNHSGSDGYAAIVAGQVKGADVTVNFDGITVKEANMTVKKYSGGLISSINSSSGVTLNFTDCLVDVDITSTDGSNGSIGLVFGFQDANKSKNATFNFNGVVATGTIDSKKNTGAFIGDLKNVSDSAPCTVNIENSAVIGFKNSASSGSSSTSSTFVGNSGVITTITNSYYQENGTNILIKGDYGWDVKKQGEAVSLETLAGKTLSSNITLAYDKSTNALTTTLNGNSVVTKETTVLDLSTASLGVNAEYGESISSVEGTNTYKFYSYLHYYEAVVAGKAGYGTKVQFTLPKLSDEKIIPIYDGVSVKGLTSYTIDKSTGIVTGYIILDNETKLESGKTELETVLSTTTLIQKEIKIVWANDDAVTSGTTENPETIYVTAKPVTYTINFQNNEDHDLILKDKEPAHAAIAAASDTYNSGLSTAVDTNDNTKLNVTSGTIAYNNSYKGNTVFVQLNVPSGITVSNESVQAFDGCEKVSGDSSSIILAVNVKVGDTKFKFTWDKAKYDMDEYTINVASSNVTLEAKTTPSESITDTLYLASDISTTSLTLSAGASQTWGKNLKLVCKNNEKVQVNKASDSKEVYTNLNNSSTRANARVELKTATSEDGDHIVIDLSEYSGNVTIRVSYATGGSDARKLKYWKDGEYANAKNLKDTTTTSKQVVEDTFTVEAGSKYYIGSASSTVYVYAIALLATE